MRTVLSLTIPGRAAPQGSKRAMRHPSTGNIIMLESSKRARPWRLTVQSAAVDALPDGWTPLRGVGLHVFITYTFARPKSHYGTGRNAGARKPSAAVDHVQRPDLDKLDRCTLDALTGVVWHDDSQVVMIRSSKHWGVRDLATISVEVKQ